jgi:radical SAM protein with 4Fe4S-binding SPASM domain
LNTHKRLREVGIETYVCYTASPYNIGRLEETYREIKNIVPEFEKKDFHLSFYHESEFYFNNVGKIRKKSEYVDKLKEKTEEFIKIKKGLGPVSILERKYMKLIGNYLDTGKSPLPCKALSSSCYIDPQGNVYPCTIFGKKLGNLRDYDFDLRKIWNSEKANEVRGLIKENKCPGCWTPCEAYQTVLGNFLRMKK